jgi:hypothetical protein
MAGCLQLQVTMRLPSASALPLSLLLLGLVGCTPRETFEVAGTALEVSSYHAANASYHRQIDAEREERAEAEGRQAYAEAAEEAAAKNPKRRCTEVRVLIVPRPPPGTPAPRAMDCNGRVLVQDAEGKWRDYDAAPTPASAPAPTSAPAPASEPAEATP